MPAENDPAEPNALMQSLQLTCSLAPSSTVPSTRLVIIWLKRCLARSPIDPALESEPVGVGVGVAVGVGEGEGVGVGVGVGLGVGVGVGVGDGGRHASSALLGPIPVAAAPPASRFCGGARPWSPQLCAAAGSTCISTNTSEIAAVSTADRMELRVILVIVSARTACRHRWEA